MSGRSDIVKGRIKEAVGALTGNDALRDEGKADQAVGNVKRVVEKVAENIKTTIDNVVEKTTN